MIRKTKLILEGNPVVQQSRKLASKLNAPQSNNPTKGITHEKK